MSKKTTIFRTSKDKANPFVMIDKRITEDPGLSWKAKGILAYLLSRPDNWEVQMEDLIKRSSDGEYSTRGAVKELIDAGYIRRVTERGEHAKFTRFIMEVYEQPFRDYPQVDNPQMGNPQVGNRALIKTERSKTEVSKTESPLPDGKSLTEGQKPKSEYVQTMEHLETVFAEIRGCPPPAWTDPKADNKRWRMPLNRMYKSAGGDLALTLIGVRAVTTRMKADGLTFSAPDGIEKSFASWIIDHAGKGGQTIKSQNGGMKL